MYHVHVIGLVPAGWLKSLSLGGPLRALKGAARALPGFKGATCFKAGRYQFAALCWTSPDSLRKFESSDALSMLDQAAHKGASTYEVHSFVCENPPSKGEIATLWHSARYSAAA